MYTHNPKEYYKLPHSICQNCANAVSGCSWARDFVPVEGWDAEPTVVHLATEDGRIYEDPSFLVKHCPLFQVDDVRHTKTIRTDRINVLCFRMLWSAAQDYANSLIKIDKYEAEGKEAPQTSHTVKNDCELFFRSELAEDMMDMLGIGVNPDVLINAIKADPHGVLRRIKSEMNPRKPICVDYDDYCE